MSELKLVRAWRSDDGEVVVAVVGMKRILEYILEPEDALRLLRELSEAIGHDCSKELLKIIQAEKAQR